MFGSHTWEAPPDAVVAMAERGVRSSVIRLAPIVHSSLDHHGFTHRLIDTAREKGVSAYVGDGSNQWPAVHTLDAADLYRLALEAAPAGSQLHGAADEGIPFRDIAEVIGRKLDLPVASIAPEEANERSCARQEPRAPLAAHDLFPLREPVAPAHDDGATGFCSRATSAASSASVGCLWG